MKTFRNIAKIYPVNINLYNSVDKDVQSMLSPFNLMQYMMFCPKYRIKDNIITPNSLISNFCSMIVTLVFICLYILGTYLVALNKKSLGTSFQCIAFYFDCFLYCIGFAMNFVIGIIQTKNNVQFVLCFQKVHRFINNETSSDHFVIWNWILGIVAISFYVILHTYFMLQLGVPFYAVYASYFMPFFDFNIVYALRIIQMLKNKVILWNFQVLNWQELGNTHSKKYMKKVFQAYVNILECYNIHKFCYQPFMLFHIFELFNSLCYFQVAIETFKKGKMINNMDEAIIRLLSVLSWLIKDVIWQSILILQCEKFYLAIQSVQDTCGLILKSTCSNDEKKFCKNVLRLHRASFSKIRICGLFHADAALQLSLMSCLTNYTVVLLQFAFL